MSQEQLSYQLLLSLFKQVELLSNKLDSFHSKIENLEKKMDCALKPSQISPHSLNSLSLPETKIESSSSLLTVSNGAILPKVSPLSRSSSRSSLSDHEKDDMWTVLGDYPHNK
jgi:hypothetical protein